jgi:hypothetical protein
LIAGADADEIYGSVTSHEGNKLYTLRAPDWCVQYDPAGKPSWYERDSLQLGTWRGTYGVKFGDKSIFGSSDAGALYYLDPSNYADGPSPQVLELWCSHLHRFPSWLSVWMLKLDVVTGVGLESGADEDVNPSLMIDYSDDGGRNFKGERSVSIGQLGEYAKQITTTNWGLIKEKGRIWRFRASPAVIKCIMAATVAVSEVRAWRG